MDSETNLFRTVNREHRIFKAKADIARSLPTLPQPLVPRPEAARGAPTTVRTQKELAAVHHIALEEAAPPSVLVDDGHCIVHISDTAGRFLLPSRSRIGVVILRDAR